MDSPAWAVLPFIGLAGGFLSGLLGLGGGVIMLPLLTFVGGIPLKLATGTDLVHVLIAATTSMFAHLRAGNIDFKAGILIGLAGIAGGWGGSFLSVSFSPQVLQGIYLSLVGLAVIILFVPASTEAETYQKGSFNKAAGMAMGCAVGLLAGLLGVGGGFILIPLMIRFLRIPLRITIGTSLLVILVTSLGTIWAKFGVGHIHLPTTLLVLSGSIAGALLGAFVSRRTPVRYLRFALLSLLIIILASVGYKTLF